LIGTHLTGGTVFRDIHEGIESTLTMLGHKLKNSRCGDFAWLVVVDLRASR
jgi:hypothetical protein